VEIFLYFADISDIREKYLHIPDIKLFCGRTAIHFHEIKIFEIKYCKVLLSVFWYYVNISVKFDLFTKLLFRKTSEVNRLVLSLLQYDNDS